MKDTCTAVLGKVDAPARHGIEELIQTLKETQFSGGVTLGSVTGSAEIASWVHSGRIRLKPVHEAFSVCVEPERVIVAGFDDVGLMYGCLALCEKLRRGRALVSFDEAPYLETRGIYELPHNRDLEKDRFYSKEYWTTYFNMLARNRINSFNYVFSHQTSYMAPVFAYFLRDEKYPQVRPDDVDEETIDRNDEMMAFITQLAADRGITFILGIWEIYPWNGGEGDWRHHQENHVQGLTEDILEDYVYRGAKAMLTRYPAIAGIQVRVNEESSIPTGRQTEFFKNTIFRAVAETGKLMDYRGWLALPETTQAVIDMCPNLRASMKYWAEFLGAPYQPAKIEPGYSYGDLLVKPMPYRFMWQVWSLGSPRLLLWGDPQYVRRFVESCRLGGAEGFEINPMLAQKGYGNAPGFWRIFKHREDEYYAHEYERYWMFYLLMGRMAYDPGLAEDVWMDELKARFGEKAESLMRAYTLSSRVITFLIQYSLSDPNMYTWPETDIGGLLEFYLETPTSDRCVLQTIPEFVAGLVKGRPGGKRTPHDSAAQFNEYSEGILAALRGIVPGEDEKELRSSLVDFKVLAYLARYHALKTEAGIRVEGYFQTGDGSLLREAQDLLRQGTMVWEAIISLTEDVYYDRMVTGPSDAGCWKAKRSLVYEDELRLAELCALHERYGLLHRGFDFGRLVSMKGFENRAFDLFERFSVERGFEGVAETCAYSPERGFGFVTGDVQGVGMGKPRLTDRTCDWIYRRDALYKVDMSNMRAYRSPLTEDYLYGSDAAQFRCDLENGEYMVTLLFCDQSAEAALHGPFAVKVNGETVAEDLTVMPLTRVERRIRVSVTDGTLLLALSGDWFISALMIQKAAPSIAHMPPRRMHLGEPGRLCVTATVPGGEADRVSLILDGRPRPMRCTGSGHYAADISDVTGSAASHTYSFEAEAGDAREKSGTYTLTVAAPMAFRCSHEAVKRCRAGEPVPLSIEVEGNDAASVLCHYSRTDQTQPLHTLCMEQSGNTFTAVIPAQDVSARWDLLYYFEILREGGDGALYPDFRERTPYYVMETEA